MYTTRREAENEHVVIFLSRRHAPKHPEPPPNKPVHCTRCLQSALTLDHFRHVSVTRHRKLHSRRRPTSLRYPAEQRHNL